MVIADRLGQADKFIVNVSSVEGEFYHKKTTAHPHTNMAKVRSRMRMNASDSCIGCGCF
jgi:succinate dehydrogenase/fumarate reductase-like Fe-S protein